MRVQPRWSLDALAPLATGLLWLLTGFSEGALLSIVACVIGVPLLATATALLLWPGDRQITHYLALVALPSPVVALLVAPWFGFTSLALVAGGLLSFLVAGRVATRQMVLPEGVPPAPLSFGVCRKVATDEALLGFFVSFAHIPRDRAVARDVTDLRALRAYADENDWTGTPEALHRTPVAPVDFRLAPKKSQGCRFEWLRFDSGFEPAPDLPGVARWQAHGSNRRMAARIFRHPGGPRPWLICIHGYRMGLDGLDLSLFRANRMHHTLGLNVAMPILPLHGARSIARITGGHFLDGPLADLVHAQAQGLWDLRRLKAWIAAQQPGMPIGALGYSLGGYHAALLAAFEADLACVIAGIPLTDIPAALWRHMPGLHLRYMEAQGISQAELGALMAPVSPLHLAPVVPHERRYIFAATADQLVDPAQPYRLWEHWGRPVMHWYHGSHLSVRRETDLLPFVENALRRHGLLGNPDAG